jgi:hypothetical protein
MKGILFSMKLLIETIFSKENLKPWNGEEEIFPNIKESLI